MVFIVAYRLKRKNARRKVEAKITTENKNKALSQFKRYCDNKSREDAKPKQWELLTGDWKHITFYEREANDEH